MTQFVRHHNPFLLLEQPKLNGKLFAHFTSARERNYRFGKVMNSKLKFAMGFLVLSTVLYRIIFNDSIASNFETPSGYSAPQSIAEIEKEEERQFKKALSEATPPEIIVPISPQTEGVATPALSMAKKALKLTKNLSAKRIQKRRLAKLEKETKNLSPITLAKTLKKGSRPLKHRL